jgi:hypothetical protein
MRVSFQVWPLQEACPHEYEKLSASLKNAKLEIGNDASNVISNPAYTSVINQAARAAVVAIKLGDFDFNNQIFISRILVKF